MAVLQVEGIDPKWLNPSIMLYYIKLAEGVGQKGSMEHHSMFASPSVGTVHGPAEVIRGCARMPKWKHKHTFEKSRSSCIQSQHSNLDIETSCPRIYNTWPSKVATKGAEGAVLSCIHHKIAYAQNHQRSMSPTKVNGRVECLGGVLGSGSGCYGCQQDWRHGSNSFSPSGSVRGEFSSFSSVVYMMIVLALQIIDRKSRMVIGRGHVLCLTRQKSFSDPVWGERLW